MRHLVLAIVAGWLLAACAGYETDPEDTVVLRFAVLGDAEPKPEAQFPYLEAAVRDVNALAAVSRMDFVVGVGDIAHKGTLIQYENATLVLQQLDLPFYPIMGNEEHGSTVERFLDYANRWNHGQVEITSPSYVQEYDALAIVYASPDFGRDFDDSGIRWMLQQIKSFAPKPVLLVVHGAQAGAYPENADKGIHNPGFAEVVAQPNLSAVISGDLHMDMDRVNHSKQIGAVHYLHIPALERTKIPDETRHDPMFRVFTLFDSGEMKVETFRLGEREPLVRHAYRFQLRRDGMISAPAFRLQPDSLMYAGRPSLDGDFSSHDDQSSHSDHLGVTSESQIAGSVAP